MNYDIKYTYKGSVEFRKRYSFLYYHIYVKKDYTNDEYKEYINMKKYPLVKRKKYNLLIELKNYHNGIYSNYIKRKYIKQQKTLKIKRRTIPFIITFN